MYISKLPDQIMSGGLAPYCIKYIPDRSKTVIKMVLVIKGIYKIKIQLNLENQLE